MQQTLAYLRVTPDLPLQSPAQQASSRALQSVAKDEDLSDFDPAQVADPTVAATPAEQASGGIPGSASAAGSKNPTMVVEDGEGIAVPRFAGMTVRNVIEECLRLGFNPVPVGTGIALEQMPAPGVKARPGSRIVVRFAPAAAIQTVAQKGK
jgi:cell division protein FtsI (penicillin-binding protein 3)